MPQNTFAQDLSPQQITAIASLFTGLTVTGAAELAGVHRSTVYNWRRDLGGFRAALHHSRAQTVQAADALDTIRQLLESEKTPASIKLKAAQSILAAAKDLATPPKTSKTEQFEDEIRGAMDNSELDELFAGVTVAPEPAPAPLDNIRHNSTLPVEDTDASLDGIRHNSTLQPEKAGRRTILQLPPRIARY